MATNSELKKFGDNLKKIRLESGLSQEKLAELSGLHRTYVGGVERGERNLALNSMIKLARALKCKPSDLLLGNN